MDKFLSRALCNNKHICKRITRWCIQITNQTRQVIWWYIGCLLTQESPHSYWAGCHIIIFTSVFSAKNTLRYLQKESQHFVGIWVLSPQGSIEWAPSMLIIPKKNGRIWCMLDWDLRALNKVTKWNQYPLPIINDILLKRTWYTFFTRFFFWCNTICLNLTRPCTIVIPFGKFKYDLSQ